MAKDDRSKAPEVLRVLAYYSLLLTLAILLVAGYGGPLAPLVFILLLVWCTRSKFPLRPRRPDQKFTPTETRAWFSGAAVAIAVAIAISYLTIEGGALQIFRSAGVGSVCWAFAFLAFRSVRRIRAEESGGQTKNHVVNAS